MKNSRIIILLGILLLAFRMFSKYVLTIEGLEDVVGSAIFSILGATSIVVGIASKTIIEHQNIIMTRFDERVMELTRNQNLLAKAFTGKDLETLKEEQKLKQEQQSDN